MGEVEIRVRCEIRLDLFPVVRLVSHFLAVAANGQESLQSLHVGESCLDLGDARGKTALQLYNALSDAHPRLQLHRVEGLRYVVVGARGKALRQVFLAAAGSNQNDVHELEPWCCVQTPADLDAFDTGHHPI